MVVDQGNETMKFLDSRQVLCAHQALLLLNAIHFLHHFGKNLKITHDSAPPGTEILYSMWTSLAHTHRDTHTHTETEIYVYINIDRNIYIYLYVHIIYYI